MANEIITTLHPDQDPDTNLYPNIKKDNIPDGSISAMKLDPNVLSMIGSLKPSGVDTSSNILSKTSNDGIWVGSDTGKWYYWDGSQYVEGGVYQTAVNYDKLEHNLTNINNWENRQIVTFRDGDFNGSGQEIPSTTYSITDPLYFNDYIRIEALVESGVTLYGYYYNRRNVNLGRISITTDTPEIIIENPNVSYIRFNVRNSNLNKIEVNPYKQIASISDVTNEINLNEGYKTTTINLSEFMDMGSINQTTGLLERFQNRYCTPKFLKVLPETIVTAQYTSEYNLTILMYDKNKNYIDYDYLTNNVNFKLYPNTYYIRLCLSLSNNITLTLITNGEWECDKYRGANTIAFQYYLYPSLSTDSKSTDTSLGTTIYFTSGLLRLPPNYNEKGNKVPVIYFAHGSADYNSINDIEFSSNYMDYISYLQDEGYAIFDCFGNTGNSYNASGCQWADPTNMATIRQGIEWCCKNYNIDLNNIYVMGKSLGGLQAINMCYENGFKIKACCPLAPELDSACDGFGYNPDERKWYAKQLGFTEDVNHVLDTPYDPLTERLCDKSVEYKNYVRENATKLLGYNPIWRGLIGANAEELIEYQIIGNETTYGNKIGTMNRICFTPTKIFIAQDDTAVSYDMSKGYIQSLKNCGCVGELRTMPNNTGGHHSVDTDVNALKVASIVTKCGVTHINVPLAYVEVVEFFRRYK